MTLSEASDRLYRASIGVQKIAQINAIAAKHRPKFSAFFRNQKVLVLEKFKDYQFLFTEEYRALREEARPNEFLTTHDWDRLWNEAETKTFDNLQRTVAAVESDGVLKGGQQMQKMFASGHYEQGKWVENPAKFWDLKNPRAVAWFQQNGGSTAYIKGIQKTTGDQIRTIITKAIDSGQSYQQTAKEISDSFDGMSRDRAQRIAVNEATHAYENGNLMFAQGLEDDGVEMEKAWNTSEDEKVCDTCTENEDAGYIPLNDPFPSGHQVPPAHLGDRCYLTYRAAQTA